MADEALEGTPSIEHVVVLQRRPDQPFAVDMQDGRDRWYHELMQDATPGFAPEPMDAEDMLYILYTSGTTGKPKGIVHTTAAISSARTRRHDGCSTCGTKTSTGARPTSAG